jgi:hypothetical protein
MGYRLERWLVKPLSCPRVVRYCSGCGVAKAYICSERFRINAQKKIVDVWLKYRCIDCGDTWKLPLLERQAIAGLDKNLYAAFVNHDPALVSRYACDIAQLRQHALQVDADIEFAVERSVEREYDIGCVEGVLIVFDVPFQCEMRIDRLLSAELGVSRATVQRWGERGALRLSNDESVVLSKPVRNGLQLLLRGDGCDAVMRPLAIWWRLRVRNGYC